jgi:photosystem II stability/assembly factor-like uncharacterized protein
MNPACNGLSDFPGEPAAFYDLLARAATMNTRRKFARLATLLLVALSSRHAAAQAPPGGTWERVGPDGGEVVSVAAGSDGTLYLATPDGHVFASTDRARHWELRGRAGWQLEARPDGRLDGRIDGVVQRLLVDSRVPLRLFAAIWFQNPAAGGGVYRSEDAGRTWSLAGLRGEAVRALEQSSSQPETFVAGSRSGVFRSSDAGRTWERISPAGDAELRNLDSLAIDPSDPHILYAGTYHLPWKTSDGGKTWAPVAAGMIDDSDIMSLRVDAANSTRLFASACSGIYRSENAGLQWTKLAGVPYAARRTQAIAQDPGDPHVLYAGTTEGLWITRDAGETWTRTTPRDWAVNGVAVLPQDSAHPARVVLGTEAQGVQASDDAGLHFAAANTGFSHRVVAAFAASASHPGHWLVGFVLPATALLETRDAGQTWQPLAGLAAANARFFASSAGWFAAPAEGGLLRYDEAAQVWRRFRFVSNGSPQRLKNPKTPRQNRNRPQLRAKRRLFPVIPSGACTAKTRAFLWPPGRVCGPAKSAKRYCVRCALRLRSRIFLISAATLPKLTQATGGWSPAPASCTQMTAANPGNPKRLLWRRARSAGSVSSLS